MYNQKLSTKILLQSLYEVAKTMGQNKPGIRSLVENKIEINF